MFLPLLGFRWSSIPLWRTILVGRQTLAAVGRFLPSLRTVFLSGKFFLPTVARFPVLPTEFALVPVLVLSEERCPFHALLNLVQG